MRLGNRICGFIFVTITATLLLLTVLMHFKYKTTRLELVNARYSIVVNDMKWAIERATSLGVELSELKNVQQIIEEGAQKDKSIVSIVVFAMEKNKVKNVFATKKEELELLPATGAKIREAMYASKKDFWSVEISDQKSFIGLPFKDAIGGITGGLYIVYSPELIKKESQKEINSLYIRLLSFLAIAFIMSYIISYKSTKDIDSSLVEIDKYVDNYISNPEKSLDANQIPINDICLKPDFINTINTSNKIFKTFDYLKRLISQVK